LKKTLLLVGGGHAHVEVLRQLALNPPVDADIALFNPSPSIWYSGMLPGVIAGHYEPNEARLNLWALCQRARVRFFETSVLALHAGNLVLESGIGERHRFDMASVDVGSVSKPLPASPGAYVVTVKPIEPLLTAITEFESVRSAALMVRIIGGGAAALEVALALAYRWRESKNRKISIVSATRLLDGFPSRVRTLALHACKRHGVSVLENRQVNQIEPTRLRMTDGNLIDTQLTVLATGYAPAPLLQKTDLGKSVDGSIHVDASLQSTSHPHVFAAGDCAYVSGHTMPKSGVYAVRQGPSLAGNLIAKFNGGALANYVHNPNALNLISLGDKWAIATRNGLSVSGKWAWRWKDSIDRKWMNKYVLD
jgi:pyridine nucleotide-disulfide oxidoreductase family protein